MKADIFRDQYFLRFPSCRLHLIILGHIGYFFAWSGIIYGWDWCQSMYHNLLQSKRIIFIGFNALYKKYKTAGSREGRFPKFIYFLKKKETTKEDGKKSKKDKQKKPKKDKQDKEKQKKPYCKNPSQIVTLRLNGPELMTLFKLLCVVPIFEYATLNFS